MLDTYIHFVKLRHRTKLERIKFIPSCIFKHYKLFRLHTGILESIKLSFIFALLILKD